MLSFIAFECHVASISVVQRSKPACCPYAPMAYGCSTRQALRGGAAPLPSVHARIGRTHMGADVDEVQRSKQSRGHHEAAAKGRAWVAEGTPREQHVAQRQQHSQRDDDDHKEGADSCAIKEPPPAARSPLETLTEV